MSNTYAGHLNSSGTTQHEPLDEDQRENWGGGYSYEISPLEQLDRFLILGSEDGNFYADASPRFRPHSGRCQTDRPSLRWPTV